MPINLSTFNRFLSDDIDLDMSPLLAALFAVLLYLLVRLLHITTPASAPLIYAKDRSSQFVQSMLTLCPILQQHYTPPLLWGKSGHIQTVLYAKMGRVNVPVPSRIRHSLLMGDGATLTFDLHEPTVAHQSGGSYCLLICPGIGNNSESRYMKTLVDYAQRNGYMAVVLNHIGSHKTIPLTAARIFTYGGTEELHLVRKEVQRLYPECQLILVGCSMGGNIVVKYLGESKSNQTGILAAVSICQGYDFIKARPLLLSWQNFRRAYLYIMTRNQRNLIRCHKDQLLSDDIKQKCNIDENKVFSSKTLEQLDESFTRRFFKCQSVDEYYQRSSCSRYLSNVRLPLLLVNAEDDPIVPKELLEFPMAASCSQSNVIFALTKHGGHLGFFENGLLRPDCVTWMDRLIVQYADTVVVLKQEGRLPSLAPDSPQQCCNDDHLLAGDEGCNSKREVTSSADELNGTNLTNEIVPVQCLNGFVDTNSFM